MSSPLDDYAGWVRSPPLPERPAQTRSSYFVCGTPRSGTWLLCGLLASTGVAGRPHEWFWRDTEDVNRRAWGVSRFSDYVARVRDAGTTPNGVFAAKLMWGYFEGLLARLGEPGDDVLSAIERHFPRPRFVWVRREDVVAQAVSWAKAIQTGLWHHWDTPGPHADPVYDGEQIAALAREAAEHDAAWLRWFAAHEVQPLTVRFEDLVADPFGTTQTVLGFLELRVDRADIAELTARTSDAVSAEWLARYGSS